VKGVLNVKPKPRNSASEEKDRQRQGGIRYRVREGGVARSSSKDREGLGRGFGQASPPLERHTKTSTR